MSEGYVTKLQKRASKNLETFIEEVKEYIPKQEVYGWDDGVVKVNCKDAILRTYCTDNVALFIGHEKKDEDDLDEKYDKTLSEAKEENEDKTKTNYYEKEEKSFINDLIKYKRNYLLWAYDFRLPSTNNNSERNIRPIKSKMKISGQFQSLSYLQYYADIRTYIETCKKNGINIIEACISLMNGNPYTLKEILEDEKNSE